MVRSTSLDRRESAIPADDDPVVEAAGSPVRTVDEAPLPEAAPVAVGEDRDDAPGTDPQAGSAEDGPRPLVRRLVLAGFVVALVLAVVAGVLWNGARAAQADRVAALEKAQAAAVELTSINYETAEQDVRRVLDGATGDFGGLFAQNLDSYITLVKESKVATTGEVTGAGLESLDGDTARAIVAVKATVHNQTVPNGESRFYRMVTELQKKDGDWLVARVEFVP